MIGKIKNLSGAKLIAFCAAVLCVLWLGKNAVAFGAETAARAGGKMETVTLSADDFELIGIVKAENGSYVTTDSDPQLVLNGDMKISRITLNCTFSVSPGEMVVYYSEKDGQGYSATKRYWFYPDSTNLSSYTAQMPMKNYKSIRIDPTTIAGNTMAIDSIVLNSPKSIGEHFAVSFKNIFNLLVYSCLIAAVITIVKETFDGLFTKRK
ncbi:MAG: hypothetical protein J6C04_01050 [Oscillospiraceae bacterium]|nr:hypothetical protein [Oscillospiraceae bacterium]